MLFSTWSGECASFFRNIFGHWMIHLNKRADSDVWRLANTRNVRVLVCILPPENLSEYFFNSRN